MSVTELTAWKGSGLWEFGVCTAELGPQLEVEFPNSGNIQEASRRHVVCLKAVSRGLAELLCSGDFLAEWPGRRCPLFSVCATEDWSTPMPGELVWEGALVALMMTCNAHLCCALFPSLADRFPV